MTTLRTALRLATLFLLLAPLAALRAGDEAGFRERQTGVAQILLTKPDCRRDDLTV